MKGGACNTRALSNCVGNSWPSKGNLCHLPSREINLPLLTFALILSEKPKWTLFHLISCLEFQVAYSGILNSHMEGILDRDFWLVKHVAFVIVAIPFIVPNLIKTEWILYILNYWAHAILSALWNHSNFIKYQLHIMQIILMNLHMNTWYKY